VLTAALVGAIVMTIGFAMFQPAVAVSSSEQVQTSLVQSTDDALYRIQRDVRQSDPNGIFICTGSMPPTSCVLASSLTTATSTQYLAILTAHTDGDGLINWDDDGRPAWTGFDIYWLVPDASGPGYALDYAFEPASIQPGTDPVILNADVLQAVTSATSSSSAIAIARSVSEIETDVDVSRDSVAIRIASYAADGSASNETQVRSDTYARN
jgi:hypothetical protein